MYLMLVEDFRVLGYFGGVSEGNFLPLGGFLQNIVLSDLSAGWWERC